MDGVRSTGSARTRIWAGWSSELSQRANPATSASCSAGVRRLKVTALARQIMASPSAPRSTIPSPLTPANGRRSMPGAGSRLSAKEGRRGWHAVGGGHEAVRGPVVAPREAHPPVGRDAFEPSEGQHRGRSPDRERDDGKRHGGHHMAGGRVAGPQDHGGDAEDGELAGGQAGQQLVGPLDVGGDAHPAPIPIGVVAGGHRPTPAARALAPL